MKESGGCVFRNQGSYGGCSIVLPGIVEHQRQPEITVRSGNLAAFCSFTEFDRASLTSHHTWQWDAMST